MLSGNLFWILTLRVFYYVSRSLFELPLLHFDLYLTWYEEKKTSSITIASCCVFFGLVFISPTCFKETWHRFFLIVQATLSTHITWIERGAIHAKSFIFVHVWACHRIVVLLCFFAAVVLSQRMQSDVHKKTKAKRTEKLYAVRAHRQTVRHTIYSCRHTHMRSVRVTNTDKPMRRTNIRQQQTNCLLA